VITGIRRSGKSTLLKQLSVHFDDFHYLNFDDERLISFTVDDFQDLLILFHKRSLSKNLFFDEIQNVEKWERFIRRVHDLGYKIFITGSNARMLSTELTTHLTGRYSRIELFPFFFSELAEYSNINYNELTTQNIAIILKAFDDYLSEGGFPEYIKTKDTESLQNVYEDILYRDIIARYGIKEIKNIRLTANYLMTNLAKEFSYQSIANILGIKSATTIKNYVTFMESVYLLTEIFRYDNSLKKQYVSNKKIYCIDSGLRNRVAFKNSGDKGRLLENAVFLELKRRQKDIYYYREKNECDFVVEKNGVITSLIQVCYNLTQENKEREFKGLLEAAKILNPEEMLVITMDKEEFVNYSDTQIRVIPVWKWMLKIE
jgi:hypothetical protein